MNLKQGRLNTAYFFLGLFAIFIGLYPLRFIGLPYEESLLGSKSETLLNNSIYLTAFYTHIFLGGLALLTGFSQFYKKLRRKRLGLHRALGKIYVGAVLLSGVAGLGIAFFATGGIIPAFGFGGLAILWLYTTSNAYTSIKKIEIDAHQRWMIRSYALCFAAVTLRLYLPLFLGVFNMEFIPAYKIIAWLCWVPNILIAEIFIVRRLT